MALPEQSTDALDLSDQESLEKAGDLFDQLTILLPQIPEYANQLVLRYVDWFTNSRPDTDLTEQPVIFDRNGHEYQISFRPHRFMPRIEIYRVGLGKIETATVALIYDKFQKRIQGQLSHYEGFGVNHQINTQRALEKITKILEDLKSN